MAAPLLTRRRALVGAAGLAASAVPAIGTAQGRALPHLQFANPAPADTAVLALWQTLQRARQHLHACDWRLAAAKAHLPWWATPGPSRLYADGTMGGPDSYMPAIRDARPPPLGFATIRFRADEAEQRFAPEELAAALELLQDRLVAQEEAYVRYGVHAAQEADDDAMEALLEARDAISLPPPLSPMMAAAQLVTDAMFSMEHEDQLRRPLAEGLDYVEYLVARLRGLRPHLTGELADDVGELLDNPDAPSISLRVYLGRAA